MTSKPVIKWTGVDEMFRNLDAYERQIKWAVRQLALYWGPVLEAYAKANAPWKDQTTAARNSLHYWIEDLSKDSVRLWLSHGVNYGVYLETKQAGKWGIVWKSIERHLEQIHQMLRSIFGK